MTHTLWVNETFRSLQGEGPSAGQAAVFLRLANCNLACTWCDTRYSWDWKEFDPARERHRADASDLASSLISELGGLTLLIITGGEPLLQQRALISVIEQLRQARPEIRVEVETNGTVEPSPEMNDAVDLFVVSPKLSNASMPETRRVRPTALRRFPIDRMVLKFVLTDPDQFDEVRHVAELAEVPPGRVWVMPEGVRPETVTRGMSMLSGPAVRAGYSLSPRLHVMLWGDLRGR